MQAKRFLLSKIIGFTMLSLQHWSNEYTAKLGVGIYHSAVQVHGRGADTLLE